MVALDDHWESKKTDSGWEPKQQLGFRQALHLHNKQKTWIQMQIGKKTQQKIWNMTHLKNVTEQ